MLFNSLSFLIFFPICIAIYFIVPKRVRSFWLLFASLYFYMCWNVAYVLLLLTSVAVTYLSGLLLAGFNDRIRIKKAIVAGSLVINIGILVVFKYLNFLIDSINTVAKTNISFVDILLPVGISFYTFQAVGYTIDVFRGSAPERNFVKYALFVSFFPQLVAGPIERSGNLLGQINRLDKENLFSEKEFIAGFSTMLWGYFLKLMIADRASIAVNTVFDINNFRGYSGLQIIVAMVLFSVQIYCDFAGYTYIAIGAAKMMGIKLCDNFNTPYLSVNLKDFWDRWHMSLSTWFRDYLYFPLGGSRKGSARKYLNILIIFLVSGLWHGAAWHFVIWGLLHGIIRVIEEMLVKRFPERLLSKAGKGFVFFIQIAVNFIVVTALWVFFRAETLFEAIYLLGKSIVTFRPVQFVNGSLLDMGLDKPELIVLAISILVLLAADILKRQKKNIPALIVKSPAIVQCVVFLLAITVMVIFGVYGPNYDASTFIYFQF